MRTIIPGKSTEGSDSNEQLVRRLLNAKKPVYLKNSIPQNVHMISYPREDGESDTINFPDTYLPIKITDVISTENLMKSRDFWAYIRSGILVPVRPKVAKQLLNDVDAADEIDRLQSRQGQNTKAKGLDRFNSKPSGKIEIDFTRPDDDGEEDAESTLNRRVQHIMATIQAGQNKSVRSGLAELKSMASDLSREDFGYLVGHGTVVDQESGKVNSRITDWAMKQLSVTP